jgi:hypothetical protein
MHINFLRVSKLDTVLDSDCNNTAISKFNQHLPEILKEHDIDQYTIDLLSTLLRTGE